MGVINIWLTCSLTYRQQLPRLRAQRTLSPRVLLSVMYTLLSGLAQCDTHSHLALSAPSQRMEEMDVIYFFYLDTKIKPHLTVKQNGI